MLSPCPARYFSLCERKKSTEKKVAPGALALVYLNAGLPGLFVAAYAPPGFGMTSMDGGNAEGLSGTIPAPAQLS